MRQRRKTGATMKRETRPRIGACRFEVYASRRDGQGDTFLGGSGRLRDVARMARRESGSLGPRVICVVYDRRRDLLLGGYINGERDRVETWR